MSTHHFICYSTADALDFALKLAEDLQVGSHPFSVWIDKLHIRPGGDWDKQIKEAIQSCDSLLFLMTPDSVEDGSECKNEWVRALRYKKPVIPLLLDRKAELPFRLGSRQYIDFSVDYTTGLALLRQHLEWIYTPQGVLQAIRERMEDAKRSLRRTSDSQEVTRIQEEIMQLQDDIRRQQEIVADPKQAQAMVDRSIQIGIERERKPLEPLSPKSQTKFINSPPRLAPSYFQDRHRETKIIADFLGNEFQRFLTIVGRGGNGKTVLVCRLLKTLERGLLPDDLGVFQPGGIVYLSAHGARELRFPHLFADLVKLSPATEQSRLEAIYKDPKTSVREQIAALVETLPPATILLLDNLEDIQDAETGDLIDGELAEALQALLTLPSHTLKVILTTRIHPRRLSLVEPVHQVYLPLDQGLVSPFAENILCEMDKDGRVGLRDAPQELLSEARERTQGNPRALEHLYAILATDREASLAQILSNTSELIPSEVVDVLVGEAFNRLDRPAQLVMQALSVYGHPVTATAVNYLLVPYQPAIDSAPVLKRLVNRQFARSDAGRYYLHQVDREYALSRIPPGEPSDIEQSGSPPFSLVALWDRAADYFEQVRLPRAQWKRLDDLEAQLLEIELRCAAGDYDTAASVLVEIDFDYLYLWGHYQLLVRLYEALVDKLKRKSVKAICLTGLGHAYMSLGDVHKAIDYHQQALAVNKEISNRRSEGVNLTDLGNAWSHLGEVRKAIEYYEQALAIDKEIGNRSDEGTDLGCLGNALMEIGEVRKAIEYHQQALAIAREVTDLRSEGIYLGNLGLAYGKLGEVNKAIDCYEQALVIQRQIGDKRNEGNQLSYLGEAWADLGELSKALDYLEQALAIAHQIEYPYLEVFCLNSLAAIYLDLAEPAQAQQYFIEAEARGYPLANPELQIETYQGLALSNLMQGNYPNAIEDAGTVLGIGYSWLIYRRPLLAGIARLHLGDTDTAREVFSEAVLLADDLLNKCAELYTAQDTKALALCGLVLCGEPTHLDAAVETFRSARRITRAPGTVRRLLRLFDILSDAGQLGQLAEARKAAEGTY